MSSFRLTQISDTHLSASFPEFVQNFHRVSQHINDNRPDLVINSGDVAFDALDHPDDLDFARSLHDGLPVDCRYLPGNHDMGDNPTMVDVQPTQCASEVNRQNFIETFGEDRWQFDAAGWQFIGLNSPARSNLVDMLKNVNLRLVACGHVHQRRDYTFNNVRHIWAPSSSFVVRSEEKQELIGVKEVGLVEYLFQPDGFEVRHVRAAGQINIDLFSVPEPSTAE
jgi:DNA repair exonuclease SbcCD nuclease subunit